MSSFFISCASLDDLSPTIITSESTSAYIALPRLSRLSSPPTIPPSFYPPSRHRYCCQPSGDKGSRCEMSTSEVATVRCPRSGKTLYLTSGTGSPPQPTRSGCVFLHRNIIESVQFRAYMSFITYHLLLATFSVKLPHRSYPKYLSTSY